MLSWVELEKGRWGQTNALCFLRWAAAAVGRGHQIAGSRTTRPRRVNGDRMDVTHWQVAKGRVWEREREVGGELCHGMLTFSSTEAHSRVPSRVPSQMGWCSTC